VVFWVAGSKKIKNPIFALKTTRSWVEDDMRS